MNSILTSVVRADPEYGQLLRATKQDFRANPLPILASGLCEGAADALLVSLLEDTERERGGAALILCPEEKDCVKLGGLLERFGLRTGFYMARDLTFYNMTASHEYEHERIKVLSGLMAGEYDAVLTTPDAALGYTVPPEILKKTTVAINADEPLDLPELAKRLTGAGFVRVDLVDSPGSSPCAAASSISIPRSVLLRIRTAIPKAARMPCGSSCSGTTSTAWGCLNPIPNA